MTDPAGVAGPPGSSGDPAPHPQAPVLRGAGAERGIVGFATVVSFAGDYLRRAVVESAGPAGATLQLLQEAREKMGLTEAPEAAADDKPTSAFGRAAARCWALLLVRIFECLPLACPSCGESMRIIAFVLDRPVIERMESLRDPAFGDD